MIKDWIVWAATWIVIGCLAIVVAWLALSGCAPPPRAKALEPTVYTTPHCLHVSFVDDDTRQNAEVCFELASSCDKARTLMLQLGGAAHAHVGECR
jgi:hypothetical protein